MGSVYSNNTQTDQIDASDKKHIWDYVIVPC